MKIHTIAMDYGRWLGIGFRVRTRNLWVRVRARRSRVPMPRRAAAVMALRREAIAMRSSRDRLTIIRRRLPHFWLVP